jgi:antitoxin PrlF
MSTATVTSKGQITLPKKIRERLGLTEGDRVAFRESPDGTMVIEPETLDLLTLRGSVRPRVRGVSIDDMDAAVRRATARRSARESR